ncbi:MAG: O-antigen ligase family protein, partial [Anaerolineales bacterium]
MARIQYWSELLAQIEIWPVVLAIAISFAWPRYLPAAVMTAAFFWFVRIIAYHRLSVRTPVDWAIVLLLIMMGTSFSITLFREKTTVQLLRVLTGIALFYAIANWCNSLLRLRLLILGIVLAGLGLALTAPISVKWHTKLPFVPFDLYQRFTLLVSDTVHPNVMAGSLVILYPIGLCWALFSWNDLNFWERSISILGNVIMLGVLILTQSRGAWIALGVVILIMPLLRWRWGWIVLVLGAGALVLVVNFIGFSSAWDLVVRSDAIGGTGDRLEIWARTIYMIRDFPYTGIGMGAYPEVFNGLYPLISPDSVFMDHAHNLILQIA